MLAVGDIVRGTQFPETVEIKRFEQINEEYYLIEALGRQNQKYYEMMLDYNEITCLEKINISNEAQEELSAKELQHLLQYITFQIEEKYSGSRALGDKNLMPLPHQIEAVYGRLLQMPKVRFLLADDPGAGKTIMAGMLVKELLARKTIQRVLILVPPLVLSQWQDELFEKFGLEFNIITREALRNKRYNAFVESDFCIASMYWVIRDEIKMLLNEADFDLIIVDEAHKMAAYTHGKTKKKISRTKLYQVGESLLRQVDNCLLLTATPHKGDAENFRHLMSLIDNDIFSNVAARESLKDRSNPFIIRRLKENLKNFDGTPLFPKRTTKTIEYILSDPEKELYDEVTEYVRLYFNKALNNGNNSTAFAMMLLQRRLSSSIEAIFLSLKRRGEKLQELLTKTVEDRNKYLSTLENAETSNYDEEDYETQEYLDGLLENAIIDIDIDELQVEINILEQLMRKAEILKLSSVERKYQELEKTLFGVDALINKGEKILIFTESVDTLLHVEKKLLQHTDKIAKISGKYSIEERRKQVEFFRNECQIMLATDAGGESINLQFCNQMINYDIPWNPNKLEQRMGRIHRIGQKNEVFIFNLVAKNTREGDVMIRLLNKMGQMREDLGSDLVYDFIGEVLEDKYFDLPTMMQQAVLNREKLQDIIKGMEKILSEEHKKLLEMYKREKIDEDLIDMPGLRREQHSLQIKQIPVRSYTMFCKNILPKKRVRLHEVTENRVIRIDRLPKYIRDFAKKNKIKLNDISDSYRVTPYKSSVTQEVSLLNQNHPLFRLSMELTKTEYEKVALKKHLVKYPCSESIVIDMYKVGIVDGTGEHLADQILFFAKRQNGTLERIDPYWLYSYELDGECISFDNTLDNTILPQIYGEIAKLKSLIKEKRDKQLEKVREFLIKTFKAQYDESLEKLTHYQMDNENNKNSILINQMNAALIDIETRKEERISEVERQRNIIMKPPKRLVQIELIPNGQAKRIFPSDYKKIVEQYENQNGRSNLKMFDSFALVDFYTERYNGDPRFIIISTDNNAMFSMEYLEDLSDILEYTYIYTIDEKGDISEHLVKDKWMLFFRELL